MLSVCLGNMCDGLCYGRCSALFTMCAQVFISAIMVYLESVYGSPSSGVLYARDTKENFLAGMNRKAERDGDNDPKSKSPES